MAPESSRLMQDPSAGGSRWPEGLSSSASRKRRGWVAGPRRPGGHSDTWNNRLRHYGPGAAWTGMPPTSSPRISRAPPGRPCRLAASSKDDNIRKAVTDGDHNESANRRYGRVGDWRMVAAGPHRLGDLGSSCAA